jgi:hypothetical protein
MNGKPPRRGFCPVYLFLLIPYLAILWVPLYNHADPAIAGIPFFYWYQMLWIMLGAFAILPVYLSEERRRK